MNVLSHSITHYSATPYILYMLECLSDRLKLSINVDKRLESLSLRLNCRHGDPKPCPSRSWGQLFKFEPRCEKTGLRVFDQVPHKPGCTATEDGQRLEISGIGRRGIVLPV